MIPSFEKARVRQFSGFGTVTCQEVSFVYFPVRHLQVLIVGFRTVGH